MSHLWNLITILAQKSIYSFHVINIWEKKANSIIWIHLSNNIQSKL